MTGLAIDIGSSSVRAQPLDDRADPVDELSETRTRDGSDQDEIVELVRLVSTSSPSTTGEKSRLFATFTEPFVASLRSRFRSVVPVTIAYPFGLGRDHTRIAAATLEHIGSRPQFLRGLAAESHQHTDLLQIRRC